MKTLGVIDIGSHSIHLESFEFKSGAEPQSICTKSFPSHLGRVVGLQGKIPSWLQHHIRVSIERCLKKMRKKKISAVIISATAGFRKARNGEAVIEQLSKKIGAPIRLLSPERESELGFAGIQSELDPRAPQVFIDCGGGSTEISLSKGRRVLAHGSLPWGASILALDIRHDPPTITDMVTVVLKYSRSFHRLPNSMHPEKALVSGGVLKDLLSILSDDEPRIISLKHLEEAARLAQSKKIKKLSKKYELTPEDAANLIPGALMLDALLMHYQLDRAAYTEKSIRNGMALAYKRQGENWWRSKSAARGP